MAILSMVPSIVLSLIFFTQAYRIVEDDHDGGMIEDSASRRPEERCNDWSGTPVKNYHFQLLLHNRSIALHLCRDPEKPTWTITFNAIWSAWLPAPWFTSDNDADLVWQEIPYGGPSAMESHEHDINEVISYFRRVRFPRGDDGIQPPNAIEIHWERGWNASFSGGAYFPIDVTRDSLNGHLREELSGEDFNETSVLLHGVRGSLPNDTAAPGRDSMFGVRAQDLEQSLTSLTALGSPLFSAAMGAVSIAGGTLSMSTVSTINSGIESVRMLGRFFDDRRQARYAASEKFFDKMWCHPLFTQCRASNGDDVAVPPGKTCPDV